MDSFFIETLGVSEDVLAFVILPSLIFVARVAEVSVNTIRIIYMLGGRRMTATALGFFEALIWLMAIRQIFQHLDSFASYLAYPGGFAAGICVGMIIEKKIAYGKVIVRIITNDDIALFVFFIGSKGFRYTRVEAEGRDGRQNLIFTVLSRERLDEMINIIREKLPDAFYTVETVRTARDEVYLVAPRSESKLTLWLKGMIRN